MSYLSYEEYVDLGGSLDKQTFSRAEYRAEKKVDVATFNRFSKINDFPKELKMCIFDLIEISKDESEILSETIGNYSFTKMDKNENIIRKNNIIKEYLSNTKVNDIFVLYKGADIHEK